MNVTIDGVEYAPVEKPEPATFANVKVGDWVLQSYAAHLQRQVKILEIAGKKFRARIQGLLLNSWFDMDSIVRKLDKPEVKVSVTLEGTVSKDYDETLDSFILNNADGHTRNRIKLSTIDPATAAMVRELVEKEES